MTTVNYQETIVIPTLQKKIQDLQAANLVLEVSLLIEQAKIKDVLAKYQNDIGDITSKDGTILNLKTRIKETEEKLTSTEFNLNREISLKESILSEYNGIKNQNESLKSQILELTKKIELKSKKTINTTVEV